MSLQWDEMPHLYGGLLLSRGQTSLYMTTYGYYPPLFDLITTGYLQIFGMTSIAGRLVSVTFAVLAVWVVFELSSKMYGPKNALLASILLGTMPGFFWVSRVTMLETILIFFFTLVMFFFYSWITNNSYKALFFSGLTLGIGILAKYEILIAAIAMLATVLLLLRKRLKISIAKVIVILVIAVLVAAPWFLMVYQLNGMTKFQTVGYVMQSGAENRLEYSNRFFAPVFYLIEITWPYNYAAVHPVSLPIIILGLCGLGLFAYRRKKEDLFLLTWFIVIYLFFTAIPNKQWRYVDTLFPILAISAASFIFFLYGRVRAWKPHLVDAKDVRVKKLASVIFIVVIASTIAYASCDSYLMTARDQIHIPIDEATNYLVHHLDQNQSAVLVCASNLLDQDMFRFYLPANMSADQIWQYPDLAVDAFTPNFNITEFAILCQQRNVKYIILFDYGPHTLFFNSTLDYQQVETMIYNTHRFGDPLDQPFFGDFANNKGYRLFLVRFLG
jgi:asparagine N-glycosylation enzyme membrane subunit Stt3